VVCVLAVVQGPASETQRALLGHKGGSQEERSNAFGGEQTLKSTSMTDINQRGSE
jgi:hypothetical protein